MRTISTGEPSTLATYRKIAMMISGFNEESEAVKFIDDQIAKAANGENEEVIADERQMLFLLISQNKADNKEE